MRFVMDVLSEILWLRRHDVEAAIDLEFFSKFSTLMAFLSGARVRVGFHLNDFWRYSLVTHPIYFNYYRHLTDVYEQAAQQLDVPIIDHTLKGFDPGDEARNSAKQSLEQRGWKSNSTLLGINVNAGELSFERRWTLDGYAELIQKLLRRHSDLTIVLTGAPSEKPYVDSLVGRVPIEDRARVIVVAGLWSLDEFVAGLHLFDGFVTNDSGPLHLAAAAGVPIVSIWGPSRPDFYAPRVGAIRKIYGNYPCSPCVGMFTTFEGMWCNHRAWCMEAIEPDTVLDAVEAMLAEVDGNKRESACARTIHGQQG
ncbi:MAG: glycosyltransferase family 9 protein [Phycisphaerae bacterium]|nr:glycosyltransferase family 9 protein [Phycisphaerae bacterium]